MSLVDLGKRLLEAAKRGETDEVRTLMSNGAPFTTDWLGTSPLHFSAQFGHVSTAEVLLRAGISRDARTKVDRTPLHVAAQEGHVEIVNLLLQHAADIDAKDMLKMTPLHWATEKGHLAVIDTLLRTGANATVENKFERTPLDIAVINGRPDVVQAIQLAQHTAIGSLTDAGEIVTVETSEVPADEMVIEGAETIAIEGSMSEEMPVQLLQTLRNIKEEGVDPEGNSTSVLATLAALAEATAPNNITSTSTTDAMHWLESQGITMISTADGNIITSAVESGQTITLTEAGKIALNIINEQGLPGVDETTELQEDPDQEGLTIVQEAESGESVLTIAPQTIGEDGEMVIAEEECDEPPRKRGRTETDSSEIDVYSMLQNKDVGSGEGDADVTGNQEALRKELEEFKKQAVKYKEELEKKDKDLEQYKKQLGQIEDPKS